METAEKRWCKPHLLIITVEAADLILEVALSALFTLMKRLDSWMLEASDQKPG
jgi:hypothetical protein